MKYVKSKVYDPNDSDIVEGTIDFVDKNENTWYSKIVVYGTSKREVNEISERIIDELNGTEVSSESDNYAAAFNMWMDEYVNNPQSFQDGYATALHHVSEKLLGEEPSYGMIAAEQFKQYLNKLESK